MLVFMRDALHFPDSDPKGGLRGKAMRSLRITALGLALAVVSSAALAFQEQNQGAAPAQAPAAAAPAAPSQPSSDLTSIPQSKPVGTEIRIPGLGSLGVLPKMDFGLELLYGASEQKVDENRGMTPGSDDLAIRGTIRKRF